MSETADGGVKVRQVGSRAPAIVKWLTQGARYVGDVAPAVLVFSTIGLFLFEALVALSKRVIAEFPALVGKRDTDTEKE